MVEARLKEMVPKRLKIRLFVDILRMCKRLIITHVQKDHNSNLGLSQKHFKNYQKITGQIKKIDKKVCSAPSLYTKDYCKKSLSKWFPEIFTFF